jgi:hypothetical protein
MDAPAHPAGAVLRAGHHFAAQDHRQGRAEARPYGQTLDRDPPPARPGTYREDGTSGGVADGMM